MKNDIVWTINDWFDGPKIGVAEFDNLKCIYERIFDENTDEYTNNYYLTPITEKQFVMVMKDWDIWINKVHLSNDKKGIIEENIIDLYAIAEKSKDCRKIIKYGIFENCNYVDKVPAGLVFWK